MMFTTEYNMKDRKCCECNEPLKPMLGADPMWFGKYYGDKLMIAICTECYRSGKREKYDNFKHKVK